MPSIERTRCIATRWPFAVGAVVHALSGVAAFILGTIHLGAVIARFLGAGLSDGAAPLPVQLLIGAMVVAPAGFVVATTRSLWRGAHLLRPFAASGVLVLSMAMIRGVFDSGMASNILVPALSDFIVVCGLVVSVRCRKIPRQQNDAGVQGGP